MRTLVHVPPRRHLTPLLIALALFLAGVAAPGSSRAGVDASSAPERGAALTAITARLASDVVARPVRHPAPSGPLADARAVATVDAATSRAKPFAPIVAPRTPLYALLRVYRL